MVNIRRNVVVPTECKQPEKRLSTPLPGPQQERRCQDIVFLLIFIVCLAGMGYLSYTAVVLGDPVRLIFGIDSWGNVCNKRNSKIDGVSKSGRDTSEEPNVFFFDKSVFVNYVPGIPIEVDSVAICVKKCPDVQLRTDLDLQNFTMSTGSRLCVYDVPTSSYASGDSNGLGHCPPLPIEIHQSILFRCVPNTFNKPFELLSGVFKHVLDAIDENFIEKCISDLEKTWIFICYLVAVGLGVALVIAVLLRFIARIVIWVIIFVLSVGSVVGSSLCWSHYYNIKTKTDKQHTESEEKSWLIGSICATVVTVIILLVLLVMRKRILLVVELFREAGRVLADVPLLLLLPLCTTFILSGVLAFTIYVFLSFESAGEIAITNSTGFVKYTEIDYFKYIKWCHIVMMVWAIQFILACEKITIAGAVASWYFNNDQQLLQYPILKSVGRLIRYHLGSAVLGSFIITLLALVCWIVSCICNRLKNRNGCMVDFLAKCLKHCFWCFETFLKFLNSNAYIEIGILGLGFCRAARQAFNITLDNAMRLAAINSVGDFTLFLGKLGTVAVVAIVGMEILAEKPDVFYPWLPITIGCIIAFIIANSFLGVYEACIDAIFICFCEDCERNDGRAERPYYMSADLLRFVEKRSISEYKSDTKV